MEHLNGNLIFLIPHHHINGVSTLTLDNDGILITDGQTKGRIELVKSVMKSCKRNRQEIGIEGKCPTCDYIGREGSKYLSREMMTFRSCMKETIIVEVKGKMTNGHWMKHNDQNVCTNNRHGETISMTLHVNDTISFQLPGGVPISFTVQTRPSFETKKEDTSKFTLLQIRNQDDEKSISSSSSTSVLDMPPIANPTHLDYSMSLNLTMGTSTESQTSGTNPYKPKRLLSKLSLVELDSIRRRWEKHEHCDEDSLMKKKEFKCFIIDLIRKQNHSHDGDYDGNCYSIFRKTVA